MGGQDLGRDGAASDLGVDHGNQDAPRVDEVESSDGVQLGCGDSTPWLTPNHTPGEPCPLVSGWMPHLPPVPKPIGKGAAIPERKVGVQGYSGRNVASFADSGSRLTYGR